MKKYLKKLFVLFFCLIIADISTGFVFDRMIANMPDSNTKYANANMILNCATPEVLVLGSSRANHHYVCSILEDSLELSCYNGGVDGHGLVMSYAVFKSVFDRHPPKIVLLDMWKTMFAENKMDDMNCFYTMSEGVREAIDSVTTFKEKIKNKSGLYRYNHTFSWILQNTLIGEKGSDGYIPLPVRKDYANKITGDSLALLSSSQNVSLFAKMRTMCREAHIPLIMVFSPSLLVQKNGFVERLKEIADNEDLIFLDYSSNDDFMKESMFADPSHMNHNGAVLFTKELSSRLKELKPELK